MTFDIDWSRIDDVMLDMDGTLLDLNYDATFWLNNIHHVVSALTGEPAESVRMRFLEELARQEGKLTWYCTDYWSNFFQCDVIEEKKRLAHLIRFRPHARAFLETLQSTKLRTLIVTNAHRDVINLKLDVVPISSLVDGIISSHDFGVAKEHPNFWIKLFESQQINPQRSLFMDDSPRVLEAADRAGIAQVIEIRHPNMSKPPRSLWNIGIDDFDIVIPSLRKMKI